MRSQTSGNRTRLLPCIALAVLFCASAAAQAQLSTLHRFGRAVNDGIQPEGGLIADKAANLYGTTSQGGTFGGGTIFELSPPATSGPWTETILYNFNTVGSSGFAPWGNLVFDAAGNLYGTAANGGGANGTVFQLMPPATLGGAWTYNVLYTFQGGNDGDVPFYGLILDQAGNLYGTTAYGGQCNEGTVFEVSPPATQGGAWTETVLHAFRYSCNGIYKDGATPEGVLLLAGGSLYGTTYGGGVTDGGIVYKLSPPSTGQTNWHEHVLYTFTGGSDGGHSSAGLVLRGTNLYGTTPYGGNVTPCSNGLSGCGVVFELSPPTTQGSAWTEAVLYSFVNGNDGSLPLAPVIFDHSGNLYSTTSVGGSGTCDFISDTGCGAVFKLTPPATQGGAWTETTLHSFTGSTTGDQGADLSGLVFGRGGRLYGTTGIDNVGGYGTIFSIVP